MKITKTEKIWILITSLFFLLYNIPGFPAYGDKVSAMVHALLTVLPLWITVFIGAKKIFNIYELRDEEDQSEGAEKC